MLRVTVLGCGSSGGVPRIDGDWGVCDPSNPKNARLRCSLLIERLSGEGVTRVVIDTSPDFRRQMLDARVDRLDAVVYSHDHADQTHGIDDLRAFVYRARKRMPVYLDEATFARLSERFGYCFTASSSGYPAILEPHVVLQPSKELDIDGPGGQIRLTPLLQDHGTMPSLGFRIGPVGYCNDCVRLPEETLSALEGVDVFIVDALRYDPHPTHAHLAQALAWIDRVRPRQAYLTNLHIDMDYETLRRELPEGVAPAHDGLVVEIDNYFP